MENLFLDYSMYIYLLVFYLAFVILPVELIIDFFKKRLTKRKIKETLQSFFTQIPYGFTESVGVVFQLYLYYFIASFIPYQIPINIYTIILAILVADFLYYVGHWFGHNVRLFWGSHSVHHNSPEFNIATAFRFSPFDPFATAIFNSLMIFIGFHPLVAIGAEVIVLAYQFWIHSEYIPKMGFLDYIFNTPANHRVHHGSQLKYCDSNYGGILIIWDIIFGTYQREESKDPIVYGINKQLMSDNPIKVWFYEFYSIFVDFFRVDGFSEKMKVLFYHPNHKYKFKK